MKKVSIFVVAISLALAPSAASANPIASMFSHFTYTFQCGLNMTQVSAGHWPFFCSGL